MELDHMRQEEEQRRTYLEEVRHLWLLDCEAHLDDLAKEQQLANLYSMRREEDRQRMFEVEREQRIVANLIVMHEELPNDEKRRSSPAHDTSGGLSKKIFRRSSITSISNVCNQGIARKIRLGGC